MKKNIYYLIIIAIPDSADLQPDSEDFIYE